jgi:hypothetical protein
LPFGSAKKAPTIKSSKPFVSAYCADPSGKSGAGKSYVVFGKANSSAIDLSAIADASNPTGGFVINGEAKYDRSGFSVSSR